MKKTTKRSMNRGSREEEGKEQRLRYRLPLNAPVAGRRTWLSVRGAVGENRRRPKNSLSRKMSN